MPLNLQQQVAGTIVDRVSEWGEDGKERPLNPIQRGIIVKVDGDVQGESVKGVYVCFGSEERVKELAKKIKPVEITVNDTTVLAFKIKAAELNEVYDWEKKPAREAWSRLFRYPTNVGNVFENRNMKGSRKRKTVDALQLTPVAKEGPVTDEATLDVPEREA